jgi:hypothetical protein
MKKIYLLLLLPSLIFAQKKDEVVKKLANFACECIKDKPEVNETALGLCLLESIGKLSEKEKKTIGFTSGKEADAIKNIAEEIGTQMAFVCPEVFTKLQSDDEATDEEVYEDEPALSFTGTFEVMTSNEFNTIVLINEAKERKEFIWLFSFEGDSLLIKNKIAKGDKIEIEYAELEFFDAKSKTYKVYNEISNLKLL